MISEDELKNLKLEKVVDGRGMSSPDPLLAARCFIMELPKGEIIEIYASDENSSQDLTLWANKAGHEYLGTLEYPGYKGIIIRKGC